MVNQKKPRTLEEELVAGSELVQALEMLKKHLKKKQMQEVSASKSEALEGDRAKILALVKKMTDEQAKKALKILKAL